MKIHQKYIRFFRYTAVGSSTFLFDLILLFFFIDTLHWLPAFAAGLSFLLAVSINYFVSQAWVFKGSQKQHVSLASGFFAVSLMGLGIVSLGMYIFTSVFHLHYLVARIIIASFTGFWNYLVNLHYNFRVAGKEL